VTSDHWAIRSIVSTICLGTIISLAAIAWLAIAKQPIPDQLDRIATLFGAGLLAVLSRTSSTGEPQQVQVMNAPEEAVPVEEA
jgi:hypothetical protein